MKRIEESPHISDEGEHIAFIPTIVELAARTRIPTIYPWRFFVDAGGLISYSINFGETAPRMAGMVDQILRGTKGLRQNKRIEIKDSIVG